MQTAREWSLTTTILVLLATAALIALAGVEANPEELTYNFTATYIALVCGAIIIFTVILTALGLQRWIMSYLSVAVYYLLVTGVMAFNWATSGLTNWVIGIPLIITYLLAVFMPFINAKTAKFLHDELFTPTTRIGQFIVFSILAIGPIAGSFGVFLSGLFKRSQGLNGYMLFGIFYFLFLCWGTVNLVYQAWDERPWKDEK